MSNCLVAQSGGPTAVINASVAGVVRANQMNPVYEHVYGGINGVEGILQDKLFDLTNLSTRDNTLLRQTPGSALGSCRFKLKRDDVETFEKLQTIMEKHDIETLFYIGGNDSMDTVDALSQWARESGAPQRFVGIPKTVDNDLEVIDHCPGFPSAAKLAIEVAKATWCDYQAYTRSEVFVMEVMGRDAGWLAGSTVLSGIVDVVVLPEVDFDKETFLAQVKACMDKTNKCFVVCSEGAHFADGTYVAAGESAHDGFGHAVLGGAGETLKAMIVDAGIAERGVVQNLSRAARSGNFAQSATDATEAYELAVSAHMRSADPSFTGAVVALVRDDVPEYNARFIARPASEFANRVKAVPAQWILPNYRGLTQEFYDYLQPLIAGEPTLMMKDGIPETITPFNLR